MKIGAPRFDVKSVFLIHFTDQMPLQLGLGCDDEFQIDNFIEISFEKLN